MFHRKALCQGVFQKRSSCHFPSGRRRIEIHVASQFLSISAHNQPWLALQEASRSACGDVLWYMNWRCPASPRASKSCKPANLKSVIRAFRSETITTHPPTHHVKCIKFRKKRRTYVMLPEILLCNFLSNVPVLQGSITANSTASRTQKSCKISQTWHIEKN